MRYVLITHIPFSITERGYYSVEKSWGWDLESHLKMCEKLHIFAPIIPHDKDENNFIFNKNSIKFHELPFSNNFFKFAINIPIILTIFNKEFNKNDIIHCTSAAYPPLGIIANLMTFWKHYDYRLFVIDGDFISDIELVIRSESNFLKRIALNFIKSFYSHIFKYCIKNSKLTFVVGDKLYEKYMKHGNVIKIYASWIKEEDIILIDEIKEKIKNKDQNFKICFAASLKPSKNPNCAIETMKILKERKLPVKLDIFGEGSLEEELKILAKKYDLSDDIHLKGVIEYGEPFYNVLRNYDAILIPNFSGEQPRIIFDAWANGVAIIGSDIKSFSFVSHGIDGMLCDPNEPNCFADAVEKLYYHEDLLKEFILNGASRVRENTIESMHKFRMENIWKLINREI